jgi:hypothetical protein
VSHTVCVLVNTVFVRVHTVLCASESFVKAGMAAGMNTDAAFYFG